MKTTFVIEGHEISLILNVFKKEGLIVLTLLVDGKEQGKSAPKLSTLLKSQPVSLYGNYQEENGTVHEVRVDYVDGSFKQANADVKLYVDDVLKEVKATV